MASGENVCKHRHCQDSDSRQVAILSIIQPEVRINSDEGGQHLSVRSVLQSAWVGVRVSVCVRP